MQRKAKRDNVFLKPKNTQFNANIRFNSDQNIPH